VSVTYGDPEPSGLARMLGQLIEQNLARDPSRRRLLRPAVVTIESTDADVTVTLRFTGDGVQLTEGSAARAHVLVRADSAALLDLAASPLLLGLPSPLDARGRSLLLDITRRRVRVRGLARHLPAVRRLTMLLSAT
jgi:hypothetical protein